MEQRSNEWFEARRGRFTASNIHKLMGRDLYTQVAQGYILEKVGEELEGRDAPVSSAAMAHGVEMEPHAINRLQEITGYIFEDHGLLVPEWCPHFGVSPDGISTCGKVGCEVKSPYTVASHTAHLLLDGWAALKQAKAEYYWQCIAALSVTECDRWLFFSYNPTFRHEFQGALVVIERSGVQKDIEALRERVLQAAKIKEEMLTRLIF